MVAVSRNALIAAGYAARAEARIQRRRSTERRLEIRRALERSRQRCTRCSITLVRLQQTREVRFRSAWTDLEWQVPDEQLDHVLIALDGDA